jgi:manganese/zinc/iron transport system ATP- binding protein
VFTEENLRKTYGGKLTLLSQALHEYGQAPHPLAGGKKGAGE